jgi:hypothetical protein
METAMRARSRFWFWVLVALVANSCAVRAQEVTDQPAAILVYPYIAVDTADLWGTGKHTDTLMQLSNSSTDPVAAHCVWEDTTPYCSNSGMACRDNADCPVGGSCLPHAGVPLFNFSVTIAPGQPITWLASQGSALGLSQTPQTPTDPFVGLLRCVVLDATTGLPIAVNALEGVATIESFQSSPTGAFDAAKYHAIGLEGLSNNGDTNLVLGGPGAEYAGCSSIKHFAHFAEGAVDPAAPQRRVHTRLALVPCGADLATQTPTKVTVHYFVYNEFEQRLGTSKRFTEQQLGWLSDIHETIFNVGTLGTLSGHTMMLSVEGGILALAIEEHRGVSDSASAAFPIHHVGIRAASDLITLPLQ